LKTAPGGRDDVPLDIDRAKAACGAKEAALTTG
jgi:hypothetical protein